MLPPPYMIDAWKKQEEQRRQQQDEGRRIPAAPPPSIYDRPPQERAPDRDRRNRYEP